MATTTAVTTAAAPPSTPLTLSAATSTILHDAHATLGESPVHDARTGAIYYVDIEGRAVIVLPRGFGAADGVGGRQAGGGGGGDAAAAAAAAAAPFSIPTPLPVGGVTPTSDPHTLLVSQPDAVHLLDLRSRTLGPPLAAIPPAHAVPGTRFNDGLASPQGTWVGGRLHKDWREGRRGRVYALVWEGGGGGGGEGRKEGAAAAALLKPVLEEGEVGMSNGMAWGGQGTRFYLADSAAKCVLCFDACPATGIPVSGTGRVVVSALALGGAVPDGLCLDGDGRLWVALAETGAVGVYAPCAATGGVEVGRLSGLPFTRLTSCAWGRGGEDGRLIVTSREEKGEGASPAAGALVAVSGSGGRGSAGGCGVVALPA
jgi:sugar lactone lactonase YvrE